MTGINKQTEQDMLNDSFLKDVMELMDNGLFPTAQEALKEDENQNGESNE